MQFSTTFIAAVAFVLTAEAAMPWQCNMNCGKALTEFNKCKGSGNMKNCLCPSKSMFNHFLGPCLGCGDEAWQQYGKALSIPMKQCGHKLPGPVPARDPQGEKDDKKNAEKKAKYEKKAREKLEKAAKKDKTALEKEAKGKHSDAREAREDAAKLRREAKEYQQKAAEYA